MAQLRPLTRELSYQPIPLYQDYSNVRSSTLKPCFKLDLNMFCIRRPTQTFFLQVRNPNLVTWGIELGDLLVVESAEQYLKDDLLVIERDNEYRLYQFFNELESATGASEKILFALDVSELNLRIQAWSEVKIAGVVMNVVHQMRHRTPQQPLQYAA